MKSKEEILKEAFNHKTIVFPDGFDFKMPFIHIHQDNLDHSVDAIKYTITSIVERHQQEISAKVINNVNQIMIENNITDYYGIDERRLLEIIEEARAFEMIKNTFALRQSLIDVCNKKSNVMANRKEYVKRMLMK